MKVRALTVLYLFSFMLFFCACIFVPKILHPSPLITRMTNHEQFTVVFNKKFPAECAMDPELEEKHVNMTYDRNDIAWIATVNDQTTVWGRGASPNRTAAAYPPEKHIFIIRGAGFWFDDDDQYQVYRSCGAVERQVGKIVFKD